MIVENDRKQELTRLGLAGLIPFAVGALTVWIAPFFPGGIGLALNAHSMTLAYGAVIAAYMAGMGAGGLLVGRGLADSPLAPGMAATLIAFLAAWTNLPFGWEVPAAYRHAMVLAVLVYLLLRDLGAVAAGNLPHWYGALRIRLTFWAGLSVIAVISRLILWGHS